MTDLLQDFRLPGHQGIYVIGSFDRKTSLYYQQVRAFNLIWLLSEAGQLTDLQADDICVLGGGIAGVTAARALLAQGQSLTLLEKSPELLSLQRHNHTRRIHPHLYSWPSPEANNPQADLPLLNWRAGISAEVAANWLSEFTQAAKGLANIQLKAQATELTASETQAGSYQLSWQQGEKTQTQTFQTQTFKILILALGVGVERTVAGLPLHSYWEDDGLHLKSQAELLISGCGEGGLLEALRLRLKHFDPEYWANQINDPELKTQILAWEQAAADQNDPADFLTQHYLKLDLPQLDQQLQHHLIAGLKVDLHGPHPRSPLNPQATALNRLLISRLLKMGEINYLGGNPLLAAEQIVDSTLDATRWQAYFSDNSHRSYDQILIRHGASSALKQQFSQLWEQALDYRTAGTSPELLKPLWPRGFYQRG